MQIDKKKLERQQEGVDKWFDSGNNNEGMSGVLDWYTGVGKTFASILVIKRLFRLFNNHSIVILVPSETLYVQWNKVLSENFTKKELITISVFTPNQIVTNKIKINTDTVIVDELHDFYSTEYVKTIDGTYIRYKNNLGLTATYEDFRKRHLAITSKFPVIDTIGEGEAVKSGFISRFVEFNLNVKLSKEERIQYDVYSEVITDNLNKFGNNNQLELASKCLSGGQHSNGKHYEAKQFVMGWAASKGWNKNLDFSLETNKEINALWNPNLIFGYAKNLMTAVRKRKDLLYHCSNKSKICSDIIFKFPELKAIVFSESTSYADKLNKELNEKEDGISVVYHSQLDTIYAPSPDTGKLIKFGSVRLKRKAMQDITTGKARALCVASSVDKGLDIPSLKLGITASGKSNFTQYKQRGGRVKRVFNDKVALLVNLYIRGTREEAWLKSRQSKSTHRIYWVDSIDEISFTPSNKRKIKLNII